MWPDAVKSFKEHANTKSGMHSDCKNLYNSFVDQHKGREAPLNKMVNSNQKINVKKAREAIAPILDTLFKLIDHFVTSSILDYLLPAIRKLQSKDPDVAKQQT